MPHETRSLKKAPRQTNKRPATKHTPGDKNHHQKQKPTSKPPAAAKRRRTSCPDCKTAALRTLDTVFSQEEKLDDGRVRLPGYVACAAGCGYLAQRVRDPRTGRCAVVAVPDRLAERWCAVELCVALGREPAPDDFDGCYVGEVRVEFDEIDWEAVEPSVVVRDDLGYMLSAAVCEMLDDALEGRLEMGIFGGGLAADAEEPTEDTRPVVAPLCLRVVDEEPLSPRTVPAGFERMALGLRDETPVSTSESEPSD
ncbi:hypothetical protein PpBr36_01405 [Pyricularia pennisetigena]|uniref:hypothetical protein n=1 Tax=Pyricularia pennisetigena TaxID=1578925 RepID=UPI00114E636D|nr:hypothetical protein PpBr36_01405 [Pyricularia pennisetigena]TLS29047.1 hypothetical protein PpBr36_01405 [Pyricularia pennisetigena]